MGDGTYRFVGKRETMPELPRPDRMAPSEEPSTPEDPGRRLGLGGAA